MDIIDDHTENDRNSAFQYINNNFKVFYIYFNKKPVVKKEKYFFNIDHTLLEITYYKDSKAQVYIERYGQEMFNNSVIIAQETNKQINQYLAKFENLKS